VQPVAHALGEHARVCGAARASGARGEALACLTIAAREHPFGAPARAEADGGNEDHGAG
jgi:hypothetical protein